MTNYLWNIFINIKNGQLAKRNFIYYSNTKNCELFLKILWDEGFIIGYKIAKEKHTKIKIFLKYKKNQPVINSIKLMSKPSYRTYYSSNQIWKLDANKSFIIFSTNKGLKTINNCKRCKIGGEAFITIK